MKPEDIDKLFSERLGKSTPTPPADLWNRLQERIEEEMPSTAPQKEEKRRFMWVYQAAAAVVAILLAVTLLFNNTKQAPETEGTIAQQQPASQVQQPAIVEEVQPEQAIAQNETSEEVILEEDPANVPVTKGITEETIAKAAPKASNKPSAGNNLRKVRQQENVSTSAIAATTKPTVTDKTPEPVAPAVLPETAVALASSKSNTDLNAQPVEITFKFASTTPVESAEPAQQDEPSELKKKGRLAKNIFKQVRNLSNGEPIELSALGIRAEKIALETQIGKQKISKVINL